MMDPAGCEKKFNVSKNWHMTKDWVVRSLAFARLIEKADPVANKADDRDCLNGGSDPRPGWVNRPEKSSQGYTTAGLQVYQICVGIISGV